MSQGSFKTKRTQTVVFVLSFGEFPRNVSRIVIEYFCNKMLVLNLSPRHYFANILLNISSKNKIKMCFMMSIERAVESTIKPFLHVIRKPRNNQKQSVYSIVGHPVSCYHIFITILLWLYFYSNIYRVSHNTVSTLFLVISRLTD